MLSTLPLEEGDVSEETDLRVPCDRLVFFSADLAGAVLAVGRFLGGAGFFTGESCVSTKPLASTSAMEAPAV